MTPKIGYQRNLRRGAAGAALCAALIGAPLALPGGNAASAATPATATISVNPTGKTTGGIGNGFIGLSFESDALTNGDRFDNTGNFPQLLENLGQGVMRFGGDSADGTFSGISEPEADALSRLLKTTGWRALYTENLLNFNAAKTTADAKLVSATLGSSLYAFACGNEPDEYVATQVERPAYTVNSYLTAVNACYKAIRVGAVSSGLEGSDIAWMTTWLSAFAARDGSAVRVVGGHYYPLGCATAGTTMAAQAARLLSPALASTELARFAAYENAAKSSPGMRVRLTETNSACNGGVAGVSNAYASALWVIDYMLLAAQHGIVGMSFHGGLNALCGGYSPLCRVGSTGNTYTPNPMYYGMAFTRMLGPGQFLPATVTTSSTSPNIAAFALKPATATGIGTVAGTGTRVMLENLGATPTRALLKIGSYQGPVSLWHLTGGSPLATSGVKIQGASVAADGTLAPGTANTVQCVASGCHVGLAPYTAVLVTIPSKGAPGNRTAN
jgi:hypothetical protein